MVVNRSNFLVHAIRALILFSNRVPFVVSFNHLTLILSIIFIHFEFDFLSQREIGGFRFVFDSAKTVRLNASF